MLFNLTRYQNHNQVSKSLTLRYRSWPARSMKLTTFAARRQISSQLSCCFLKPTGCTLLVAAVLSASAAIAPSGSTSSPFASTIGGKSNRCWDQIPMKFSLWKGRIGLHGYLTSHDLHSYGRGSTWFQLVLVTKERHSSLPSSVV